MLLVDLEQWHLHKKCIVKYLNPQEAKLNAGIGQNTMLIDNRDSSIWFTTDEMLYQWDIRKWLSLPITMVQPHAEILLHNTPVELKESSIFKISPTDNSLAITVFFQTKDNMPRYVSVAIIKDGDSLAMPLLGLETHFNYPNLSSGNYQLVVQVFEQDGTTATHTYHITIKKFLWQQWWFWVLLTLMAIGIAVYFINLKRKKQIAEEQAKRIVAEAEALRSEQNRQLTKMQVVSLSNQFRPHFILNALNTIGGQLRGKPEIDAVIDQLGNSIGIIFKNAQTGNIAHTVSEEWKLVEAVINIKEMEYKNKVQVHVVVNNKATSVKEVCTSTENNIQNNLQVCNIPLVMGMVQIPVENALMHGLRHKEEGRKNLWLTIDDITISDMLIITITDDGIGRKAAGKLTNHKSNGVGLQNILTVIDLLNNHNYQKMHLHIEDGVFIEHGSPVGTRVTLHIPKQYSYTIH